MSTRRAKRVGIIEPPRDVIKTTRDKVIVNTMINNKPRTKVMIMTIFESENSVTIYIGDSNIYCIDCQIIKNKESGNYESGILTKARWDINCSLDDPFEKGTDSIIIIKLLLTYIKDTYPSVKHILFTDLSTKDCDDGSSVSLVGMKVFTDGKTWYESHFDVYMDKLYKDLYKAMMSNATEKKSNMSFKTFMGYSTTYNLNISLDILESKYNNSNTWQEFFSYIRNTIGVSNYCKWLSKNNWFDNFIFAVLKFQTLGLQFIFEPKKYNISYKFVASVGGKYRLTRKNR